MECWCWGGGVDYYNTELPFPPQFFLLKDIFICLKGRGTDRDHISTGLNSPNACNSYQQVRLKPWVWNWIQAPHMRAETSSRTLSAVSQGVYQHEKQTWDLNPGTPTEHVRSLLLHWTSTSHSYNSLSGYFQFYFWKFTLRCEYICVYHYTHTHVYNGYISSWYWERSKYNRVS